VHEKTSVAHTVLVNVQLQEIHPDSFLQIGFIGTRLTPGQMHTAYLCWRTQ